MTNVDKKHKKAKSIRPKFEGEYKLRIPSATDNLELIRGFVAKVAEKVGFCPDDIGKIELACDEACTNVMKHAYDKKSKNTSLDVLIKIDYQKLTLVVTDHGKGFNPNTIPMPNLKEYLAELKVGGLGIYLMRTLMDEVDYDIKPGVQNRVRMVKYLIDRKKSELVQ
ncbi:ATP-binding protein [candidate division KSB1 bacterium]|nr:ATP-binding protein [candidate division KSB1 bacterium]